MKSTVKFLFCKVSVLLMFQFREQYMYTKMKTKKGMNAYAY